ncbi:MAG: hypothetical protein KDM63_06055 [Verrucomicrobiae bacterium]|nr:hypothetical protein [Verrucomicrobiae bacterium]
MTCVLADEPLDLKGIDPFTIEGNRKYLRLLESHTGTPYSLEIPPKLIKEFGEPQLSENEPGEREVYRFTFVPSFHEPMTFRLEVSDLSKATIHVKRLSEVGGSGHGEVELSTSVGVRGQTLERLLKALREPRSSNPYGGLTKEHVDYFQALDGENWYLERLVAKKYICTGVANPRFLPEGKRTVAEQGSKAFEKLDPEPFVFACTQLANAAGFDFSPHDGGLEPIKLDAPKK